MPSHEPAWAIIVAAGEGRRMRAGGQVPSTCGTGPRKPFLDLCGVTILLRTLRAAAACPEIERTVVAVTAEDIQAAERLLFAERDRLRVEAIVAGGRRRQDSVARALEAVPGGVEIVAVHDGARPLASAGLFTRVIEAARRTGASCAALPCCDTLKRVEQSPERPALVRGTVDRSRLWAAQTPQAFRARELRRLLAEAEREGLEVTDEATLFDGKGLPVEAVTGEATNVKITTPEDLRLAEAILRGAPAARDPAWLAEGRQDPGLRVGSGFDVHRLVPGRRLVIGGVELESELGAEGHSDADVAAHAVIDALLGAAALGDIGRLFPDSDPAYAGADSLELLARARGHLERSGFEPVSVDVTVFLEKPRLADRLPEMAARLSRAAGLAAGCVSVKAKSANGVGPVGEGRAVAAQATALVRLRGDRP